MASQLRLTHLERERIMTGLRTGESPAQIARALGRNRSVVTREIHRNRFPGQHYSALLAQERRGQIPDMIGIDDRPHEVDGRLTSGHWEGDLIMGARNRSAISNSRIPTTP